MLLTIILLLIHSILILNSLLFHPPPNIFSFLNIPLNTPTDSIRALLSQHTSELELLLKRLASFDTRSLYPRFGHNVLATCAYCQSFGDFAFYALPPALLAYIREIAFIGLITLPGTIAHRRKPAVATLILMGILEAYIILTIPITIPLRGNNTMSIMWHDILLTARNTIFLFLPLLLQFVPRIPFLSTPPPDTPANSTALLAQTHQALTHLLPTLHLLKYAHAASMRVPALRTRVAAWWAEERRVGAWILADGADGATPSVRSTARALGVGFDEGEATREGKLRTDAKAAVRGLMADGLKPPFQKAS